VLRPTVVGDSGELALKVHDLVLEPQLINDAQDMLLMGMAPVQVIAFSAKGTVVRGLGKKGNEAWVGSYETGCHFISRLKTKAEGWPTHSHLFYFLGCLPATRRSQ